MKKPRISTLLLALAAVATIGVLAAARISGSIDAAARFLLTGMGFETPDLPAPQFTFNQALYKNVKLDSEGFSKIDYILLTFNPLTAAFSGHIDRVEFIGASLTGEISPEGIPTMAGWNIVRLDLPALTRANTLFKIRNSALTLLTPQFGGLSLSLDLQARPQKEDMEFQGQIASTQKHFSFDAKLSGYAAPSGLWQVQADIAQGGFDIPGFKISRLSGETKITSTPSQGLGILGKFDAGGLLLYDTAWHNVSATLEKTGADTKLFIGAKSLGEKGLDLGLQYQPAANPALSGTIHAPSLQSFLDYLESQNLSLGRPQEFEKIKDLENIDIEFTVQDAATAGEKELNYNIKNYEKEIDIKGKLILN